MNKKYKKFKIQRETDRQTETDRADRQTVKFSTSVKQDGMCSLQKFPDTQKT